MSTRPASSWPPSWPSNWPWLDDVLVETGSFDDVPFSGADALTGIGPDLDQWLGAEWFDDTSDAWPGPPANDHDPFHFEPTPDLRDGIGTVTDAAAAPDVIASVLLEAIESVSDFESEDPSLAPLDGTPLRSADDVVAAERSTGREIDDVIGDVAGDVIGDAGDVLALPELDASGLSFGASDDGSQRLADLDDDASGDLDDFDGIDGLDDFDGL